MLLKGVMSAGCNKYAEHIKYGVGGETGGKETTGET
jgi:hypothetical protein